MYLGFTGTREGMTDYQLDEVRNFIDIHASVHKTLVEAHHGDCVGSDADFHGICQEFEVPIFIHPPLNAKFRAFCKGSSHTFETQEYLRRNRAIVYMADFLLATPLVMVPSKLGKGGTWYTIRYAQKCGRKVLIIPPVVD
jgi:hypothetical protein